MKKILIAVIIIFVIASGCNIEMYSQEPRFKYKTCPANDPIGYWYKHGTGQTFGKKKHRFMF